MYYSKGTTFLEQLTIHPRKGARHRGGALMHDYNNTAACALRHKLRMNIVPGSFTKTANAKLMQAAKD